MNKLLNTFKVLLLISFILPFIGCQEKRESFSSMSVAKWENDIDYLFQNLERKHINLYHSSSKDTVRRNISNLVNNLSNLSDDAVFISLSKIIRSLDDSHTGIWALPKFYDSYPIEFFVFDDSEIRVLHAPKNHPELLGGKLISIDNTMLNEVIKELLLIIQCADNWHSERERLASYLKYSKILKHTGIADKESTANFQFLLENGTQKTVKLEALPNTEYDSYLGNALHLESPFQYEKSLIGTSYLWYQPNDELKTSYIHFSSYPNALQMKRFGIAISKDIIRRGIKNIIIDVRDNSGGDFYVGLELVKLLSFLDQIIWENGVYVLTSRKTYSAGMSNTAHFKQLLNAKIIGEPTGANPNDYQDAQTFQLPNSKLRVQFSRRYYRFQDTVSKGILPDIYIKPNWEDFKKGIDSNLEWVLDDIKFNENKTNLQQGI
ncbi:S41 family peptidase [uncultured Maribacter sp.]|uniref:S41 family peptidase n=1 Tax=uncultured Maribacter sp. TaxID=431308 RepID=UPI002609D707|nr:S41 family peptidase [uncultured Maribacter sp.]